ncbi:FEN1-like nuclease [Equine molluscum contagiosum-like virus]|nr:FEN1-like nuclease [Equine molluscum contagiosum-like virus]
MGIKNLKSLLLRHKSLSPAAAPARHEHAFVDFMGVFIAAAYSVSSARELRRTLDAKMAHWRALAAGVVLFVDRGDIANKLALRKRRKDSQQAQCERKRRELRALAARKAALDRADALYAEQRAEIDARARKTRFYLFLCSENNLYRLLDAALAALPAGLSVVYCDEVDAEFEMCARARACARSTGRWPLLLSNDQDTLCLACADTLPKTVLGAAGEAHLLRPCADTVYLAKLTVLVNGCDFFSGLAGLALTPRTFARFALFSEFTLGNVLRSLVHKNYALRGAARADVGAVLRFIDAYVSLERDVYRAPPPPPLSVQDFLLGALAPRWDAFAAALQGGSVLEQLHSALRAHCAVEEHTRRALRAMLDYYRDERPTREAVELLARMMGCSVGAAPGLVAVCLERMDLLLCFEDAFCFNDRCIIENRDGVLNIRP